MSDEVPDTVKATCRYLASFETAGHKIVRLSLGIVLTLVGLLSVQSSFALYGWSGTHYTNTPVTDPQANSSSVGTGTVTSCERYDWIRSVLFYPGWDCYVHVRWNKPRVDGTTEKSYFSGGNTFEPGLIGKPISVIGVNEHPGHPNTRTAIHVYRNLETPYTWTFVPSLFVFGILAFIFLGTGIGRLIPYNSRLEIYNNERTKLRKKLEREGKVLPTP